tara:strand:+ start:88 stop:645 length:558 start_codon:yes stop_codon:yes gene_type:complete
MKFFKTISIISIFCISLISCKGGLPGADARKVPYDPKERVKKNLEEGKGFRLMDITKNEGSGNFEFASSNALWRASLDIIDFMPLTSANYSGGILITDWYSDNQNTNQSIKITIRFLTNEVRSDALDIKVFLKKCNTINNCEISENEGNLKTELNKKILKKAAIYAKQQKDANFRPYKGLKNPRN